MARTKKTDTKKKVAVAEATKTLAATTEKIKDAVTKTVTAAMTAEKKEASEKARIVLQYAGKDYSYDELVQNAKNKFQYVYFVIDGTEGEYNI